MKAVLVLLACAVVAVCGTICTRNFCDSVTCDQSITPTSCSSSQVYQPNGSVCGCCPVCMGLVDEGGRCYNMRRDPPPAICREPLVCYNKVCTRPED